MQAKNLVRVLCLSSLISLAATGMAMADPPPAKNTPVPATADERWIITGLYTQSQLSGGRSDWHETSADLLYRAAPNLYIGGGIIERHRATTDILYAATTSYVPQKGLEVHGTIGWSPNPDFSAQQSYSAGLEWQRWNQLALLFDYKRMNFSFGDVNLYTPGATWWFDDTTYLTGRYGYGRAFGDSSFNNFSMTLNVGLRDKARVKFGFARGGDPERSPGSLSTLLTDADLYTVYLHWPFAQSTQLIVGAEHEDRTGIYRRNALTLGLSTRF